MDSSSMNRIPEHVKWIYLIAVCGTGMGALACMLKDLGFQVSGSDQHVYPPISEFLQKRAIPVVHGFDPRNLSGKPDLVVVGNAVSRDNPEVLEMHRLGLSYCSMPQAINHFAARGKRQVVVSGTHGKTTTASLLAWLLHVAGMDPTFAIGGILADFQSNYRIGGGDVIVIEGDEYDTAYFDKGPKFLHYNPHVAILTSVEFDHADIFADLDAVRSAFHAFIRRMRPEATLLAYDQDENVANLVSAATSRLLGYGLLPSSPWRLGHVDVDPPHTLFEVYHGDALLSTFKTHLMGRHNLFNALAAIAAAFQMGASPEAIHRALATFNGIKRRQEVRGVKRGITIIDDFAHHPTAVYETIKAVKPFYDQGRLVAVFEPRTNSSRRNIFQRVYASCFDNADLICIRKPPLLEKIPPDQRFSSETLVADLRHRGKAAHFFENTDAIIDYLVNILQTGDAVLIMSNGGFDNIHARLLERL